MKVARIVLLWKKNPGTPRTSSQKNPGIARISSRLFNAQEKDNLKNNPQVLMNRPSQQFAQTFCHSGNIIYVPVNYVLASRIPTRIRKPPTNCPNPAVSQKVSEMKRNVRRQKLPFVTIINNADSSP